VGGSEAEVGVDDGEDAGFGDEGWEAGGEDVDAGEGERTVLGLGLGNGDVVRSAYSSGGGTRP